MVAPMQNYHYPIRSIYSSPYYVQSFAPNGTNLSVGGGRRTLRNPTCSPAIDDVYCVLLWQW